MYRIEIDAKIEKVGGGDKMRGTHHLEVERWANTYLVRRELQKTTEPDVFLFYRKEAYIVKSNKLDEIKFSRSTKRVWKMSHYINNNPIPFLWYLCNNSPLLWYPNCIYNNITTVYTTIALIMIYLLPLYPDLHLWAYPNRGAVKAMASEGRVMISRTRKSEFCRWRVKKGWMV